MKTRFCFSQRQMRSHGFNNDLLGTDIHHVYIPHITGTGGFWRDYLQVNNNEDATNTFTLTLYDKGTQVYQQDFTVNGFSQSIIDLKTLIPNIESGCGVIKYTSEGLYFRLSYEEKSGGGVAEFRLADDHDSVIGFYFSDFSSEVTWKAIALSNLNSEESNIKLYAVGVEGILDCVNFSIAANAKEVGLYEKWFPDINFNEIEEIIAVSDRGLSGITISGNSDNSFLLFTEAYKTSAFNTSMVCEIETKTNGEISTQSTNKNGEVEVDINGEVVTIKTFTNDLNAIPNAGVSLFETADNLQILIRNEVKNKSANYSILNKSDVDSEEGFILDEYDSDGLIVKKSYYSGVMNFGEKIATYSYDDVFSSIAENFPSTVGMIFFMDEDIVDISSSTFDIFQSPFENILYLKGHKPTNISTNLLNLLSPKEAHASITLGIAVTIVVIMAVTTTLSISYAIIKDKVDKIYDSIPPLIIELNKPAPNSAVTDIHSQWFEWKCNDHQTKTNEFITEMIVLCEKENIYHCFFAKDFGTKYCGNNNYQIQDPVETLEYGKKYYWGIIAQDGTERVQEFSPFTYKGDSDSDDQGGDSNKVDPGLIYEEDFSSDPNYIVKYSSNAEGKGQAKWDNGSFFAEVMDQSSKWYYFGESPKFEAATFDKNMYIIFSFNPVKPDWGQYPGIYFVPSEVEDPFTLKTDYFKKHLKFSINWSDSIHKKFVFRYSGNTYVSPTIPATNAWYKVAISYDPMNRTGHLVIMNPDGTIFVDETNLDFSNMTNIGKIMIGEVQNKTKYGTLAQIRVDDIMIVNLGEDDYK